MNKTIYNILFTACVCVVLVSCEKKIPDEIDVKPARKAIYISRDGIKLPEDYIERDDVYYFEHAHSYDSTIKSYEMEFAPLKEDEMLGVYIIQNKIRQKVQLYVTDQSNNERGILVFDDSGQPVQFSNNRKRAVFALPLHGLEANAIFLVDGSTGQIKYLFSIFPSTFITDNDINYFIYVSKTMLDIKNHNAVYEFTVIALDTLTFYDIFSVDVKSKEIYSGVLSVVRKSNDHFGFRFMYYEESIGYREEAYYNVREKTVCPRDIIPKTHRNKGDSGVSYIDFGRYCLPAELSRENPLPMEEKKE